MATINHNKALGALMGQATGDALGTTNEFKSMPAPEWPERATGPVTQVVGGGPFQVETGQVTDDTQLACCIANSLTELGDYDPIDVAERFVEWRKHTFDIGGATSSGISNFLKTGIPNNRAGWEASGRYTASNGSLMRTSPIAVFFADDLERLITATIADSDITHFSPLCTLACCAFNMAIAKALTSHAKPGSQKLQHEMMQAAHKGLDKGREALAYAYPDLVENIAYATKALYGDLMAAGCENPDLYGEELHIQHKQGFVRVAFRLAFFQLLNAKDFRDALVDTVNRGGDADTNGAIVGALLGAFYGEQAIPAQWKKRVRRVLKDCPEGNPKNELATTYHPNRLVDMLNAKIKANKAA